MLVLTLSFACNAGGIVESTIGTAFFSQMVTMNDVTVKFEIWNTTNQERYHSLAPMNYEGVVTVIIVYDIKNQNIIGLKANFLESNLNDESATQCLTWLSAIVRQDVHVEAIGEKVKHHRIHKL
ncbi:hypothetical protein GQ457_16G017690 [Hibiscus cannabinus]